MNRSTNADKFLNNPKWKWHALSHMEQRRYRGKFYKWAAAFHRGKQ